MCDKILNICKESKSLEKLNDIHQIIPERHFHDHIYILYDLRTLLGDEKKVYTEIGSYVGHSAKLILSHPNKTEVICIDPLILNKEHYKGTITQYDTLKKNIGETNVTIYKNYSQDKELLKKLKNDNFRTDILFIDGSHLYQDVINDFNNYCEFVNKDGYIIFDDYLDNIYSPDVKKAVDYLVKNLDTNKYEIIGNLANVKNTNIKLDGLLNEFIIRIK